MAVKRLREEEVEEEEETLDRLSGLPESLQLHILSYLDARQAVQSSLLSKSWVSTWTRVPVLNFTSSGLDDFAFDALNLRRQNVKLYKLTFKHDGECGDLFLQRVFNYAFSHGVQVLEANIREIRTWPIGSSDSLTSLKFTSGTTVGCTFLEPRSVTSFKSLTNLYLKGVTINDLDPFSGFPALKKLKLHFCLLTTEGNALNVHAPQLSEFTILYYYKQSVRRCKFMTPKLKYFEWQGSDIPKLTGNLPILETVVIDYNCYCRQEKEKTMFDDLLILFNPLRNARSLTLFSPVVQILTLFPLNESSPPFPKLKRLKLDLVAFRNQKVFQRPCGSLMDLLELVPDLKAYLLPESQGTVFKVTARKDLAAEARKVLAAASARRKTIKMLEFEFYFFLKSLPKP